MHAFLEATMGTKPALQPKAAIGPAVRAIAAHDPCGRARGADRSGDFRASTRCTISPHHKAMARAHAAARTVHPGCRAAAAGSTRSRPLAVGARDGQSALNAFDDLVEKRHGAVGTLDRHHPRAASKRSAAMKNRPCSPRNCATRSSSGSMPAAAAIEQWPLDPFEFGRSRPLTAGYRGARQSIPQDWSRRAPRMHHAAPARRRPSLSDGAGRAALAAARPHVDRRGGAAARPARRCQDLEILSALTEPHQPLAHWRSRLTPACTSARPSSSYRAARIGCGCSPKSPRRSAAGWRRCGSMAANVVWFRLARSGAAEKILLIVASLCGSPVRLAPQKA